MTVVVIMDCGHAFSLIADPDLYGTNETLNCRYCKKPESISSLIRKARSLQ